MFEVMVEDHFSAAHHLLAYDGKDRQVHGHNFVVRIWARKEHLDEANVAIDYKVLKQVLKKVTDDLDHIDLNEFGEFTNTSPSCEFLAMYIYKRLKPQLSELVRTCVFETPKNCAYYYE